MRSYIQAAVAACSLTFCASALSAEVFSCTIAKNNKRLQLAESATHISYSYGPQTGKPELAVTVAKEDVELYAWEGIGRYHSYAITVPNGQYGYNVFTAYDSHEQHVTAGVNVSKNDAHVTELLCKPGSVRGDLEAYVLTLKDAQQ